jgi:hypothetical protein
MSAKSRKRNKRLLALAGLAGAVAMSNRKPKQSDVSQDSGRGSGNRPTVDTAKKDTAKKATPKAYQDDIMKGGSGTKYVDKYAGTPLRRLQNSPLRTDGLGDMDMKDGGRAGYKSGGSTGSSKSSGCAIKGISPILMKGRK